jgi:uncharacterized protein involved in exopolysaccharide biosynthesis/Mrp family chromosome partitioning ATPase
MAQMARLLRRNAVLILATTALAGAGALVFALSLPKTYIAASAFTVEGERFAIPELQGALRSENAPDPMPWVRTEVQALTSRAQIQDVITRLNLDRLPEFNDALRAPGPLQIAMGWARSVARPILTLAVPVEAAPDETVLANVTKALSVFQDNRSLVISANFTAQDPALAAKVVNTLIASYIEARAARRVQANRGANDTMVGRIAQVKGELDAIEGQMRDLRTKSELVGLRAGSVGQQQLEELATAAARASVERAQIEANWERASSLAKQGLSDGLISVLGSPTVSRLREQESTAMRRVAELSSRYGSGYPGVRSANADLAATRGLIGGEVARIVASFGAQLRVAREQEADIRRQLDEARRAGVQSENAQAQLVALQQEATTRRNLYQTLLGREQQTVAQPTGTEVPDVRVLSAAVAPSIAAGPNVKLIAGAGGLSGLLLGCILALSRHRTLDVFETAPDLARATGLQVLAALPRAMLEQSRPSLVASVIAQPGGPGADALRKLRAKLRFVGRSKAPRSVLFTSAVGARGDGAAVMAASFARVAAADGERVLLVEGNLAHPALGRLLEHGNDGLAQMLANGQDWRDATQPDPASPLDVLLAGRAMPNGSGQLSSVAFQNLLVEARQDYDLVVMDAPDAASADAVALMLRADTTVLLIDSRTGQQVIRDAIARLGKGAAAPLGAVLIG